MFCGGQIKRLEALSRSPVFSLLGECVNGLASIRGMLRLCGSSLSTSVYPLMVWFVVVLVFTAFNIVDRLTARFEAFVDDNSRYYYAFVVTAR